MKNKSFKNQKGFTLVEIIVSLGIFSIVMVVAMGAFLKIVDINKRAQSIKTAVNNLSFTMETMSREIRTGRNYTCENTPCKNDDNLIFTARTIDLNGSNCDIIYVYKLENGKILKAETDTKNSCDNSFSNSDFSDVTSDNVFVDTLKFTTGEPVDVQPYVIIKMIGTVGDVEKAKTTFNIQTFINQRI